MRRNVLSPFPNVCENTTTTEDERLRYCSHLHNLVDDMHIRLTDLISLNLPRRMFQPFSTDSADLNVKLQDQFIDLQNDDETMNKEDRYDVDWC